MHHVFHFSVMSPMGLLTAVEALSLDFGRRHLVFLEPEVTMFGGKGGAKLAIVD